MKYTKTAAALALAGCVAAPMAQAEVTLTGQVAIGIVGSDADDVAAVAAVEEIIDDTGAVIRTGVTAVDAVSGDLKLFGDDSIINVKATGELDNGLTGYANYRTDLGLVGDNAVGDNIHLGITGDFGDIRIGEVPDATGFGQVASDILADIDGENVGISYTGSFGGATIGLNWSPEGSSDRLGAGVKFSAGGFGIGIGAGTVGDDSKMSVGATFALGGASVGVAYKDFDNNRETISAKASYGIGKTSLGLTFETETGDGGAEGDSKLRFDAGYDMGSSMTLSTRVNMFTDDSDSNGDVTDYRLLLTKAF